MLRIDSLSAKRGGKRILSDINLTLYPKTITAVIGKNGCGKSTLVDCISQKLSYDGRITFCENDLSCISPRLRAQYISVLPQKLSSPHLTVSDLVALGRTPYLSLTGRLTERDAEITNRAIDTAGLCDFREKYSDELSGGELQRTYLAMILAQDTPVMLLDEPTTHLDIDSEHEFLRILTALRDSHDKSILCVLHNITLAMRFADRIAVISDGTLAFSGTRDECAESGVIERVFNVKKTVSDGNIFYTA